MRWRSRQSGISDENIVLSEEASLPQRERSWESGYGIEQKTPMLIVRDVFCNVQYNRLVDTYIFDLGIGRIVGWSHRSQRVPESYYMWLVHARLLFEYTTSVSTEAGLSKREPS